MCAPIPLGAHLRFNSLHNNPHSRAFSARRVLTIESRQTVILSSIPQGIPWNTQVQASTNFPITIPPTTALSPSGFFPIPGLSNQGIQTLSTALSVSTVEVASSADVSNLPLSSATIASSFIPNVVPSKTIISTVSSVTSSVPISTWSVSSAYGTTSSLVSTTNITPVTTLTSIMSQSFDPTVTTTSYTSVQTTETDDFPTESFTSAPSSTVSIATDPSSSIVSSSATNDTTSAVNTVTASPISVKPANLSAHNSSLYIGIVLGTLAFLACLCALIAWFIRLRNHFRRKRAARSLKVPWAKSDDGGTWGLESGHGPDSDVDRAAISAMNLGSREDLANVQTWSPRGDRDVGEPRRAESYISGSTYSLQNHPIPEHCLFNDDSVRAFVSSEGYSTASLLPHHNLRQLPSHLIDQELVARVSRERASLHSNMDSLSRTNPDCGTPRETMNKPRFLSLKGNGLNVPWHLNSESSRRSMVERLRNHGKPPAEPAWERVSPRQNSGDSEMINKNVEADWSTSFKSSLVNAFNAVAANLSLAAGAPRMNDDGFTSAPSKRTVRKSVRDTFWDENLVKDKELSRETSISTLTSKAWTLEETREGAGVVHLLIPELQECGHQTAIQRPHLSGPTLSFGDGDDVIFDGDDSRRIVEHPQVPLIASEKPPPAVVRPDPYHTRRNTRKTVNSSLSRGGSIYSTASMRIGTQTRNLVPIPASSVGCANPYFDDSSDSIVIAPSQISRLSSSDSSTISPTLGLTKEGLITASQTLKDRRNRVLEL